MNDDEKTDRNVVMRIDRKTDKKGTLTKMDYTKKINFLLKSRAERLSEK